MRKSTCLFLILIFFINIHHVISQDTSSVIPLTPNLKKVKTKLHKRPISNQRYNTITERYESTYRLPEISKSFSQILPNLYACQREITNFDYFLFAFHGKNVVINENSQLDNRYYPDVRKWELYKNRINGYLDSNLKNMDKYYFIHPAFDEYPAVGISTEIMEEYCIWLTNYYNGVINKRKIIFRLPTHKEWLIAKANQMMVFSKNDSCDKAPVFNIKHHPTDYSCRPPKADSTFQNYYIDGFMFTSPSCFSPPNSYGLYDMIGNVSEVVLVNGEYKVVGGGWDTYPENCNKPVDYVGNQPTTGFRIFMEVIEE